MNKLNHLAIIVDGNGRWAKSIGKIRSYGHLKGYENLKYLYGEENCTPQYILDRISFDCLVVVGGIKIDVEYDCIYWHQDIHKDIRRDYFTIGNGFKVLRFRSKNKIPSLEQIQDGVNYLVGSEHHHLTVEI